MSRAEIRGKFDEIVAFAEVEKFLDTPVKRYSSGMYVRLAFAVAAHLEPEILVVDEVLAVGDAEFQKKCLGKMRDVSTGGRTVLFVTHNMAMVNSLCKRGVLLKDGSILEDSSAAAVVSRYLSEGSLSRCADLDRFRTYKEKEKAFFTELTVDQSKETFFLRDPLRFRFCLLSEVDECDVSIGATLFSELGHPIGCFVTEPFLVKAQQSLTGYITVNHSRLAPGSYYCAFSTGRGHIQDGPRIDYDVVIGVPHFFVSSVSKEGLGGIGSWNPAWGSIFLEDVAIAINTSI